MDYSMPGSLSLTISQSLLKFNEIKFEHSKNNQNIFSWNFPSGPVVKTLYFYCSGYEVSGFWPPLSNSWVSFLYLPDNLRLWRSMSSFPFWLMTAFWETSAFLGGEGGEVCVCVCENCIKGTHLFPFIQKKIYWTLTLLWVLYLALGY